MIDVNLLQTSATITVQPSDRIFTELGNNTYDYKDLLSELIDNAIAARTHGRLLHVIIDIFVDDNNNPVEFMISDDAGGIPSDKLALAITPAGIQTQNSLNEHGLGMKQGISALGKLNYLATKTRDDVQARVVREFRFGDIQTFSVPFDRDCGTVISVVDIKPIVTTHTSTITRTIIPYLGARYRRFLKADNPQVEIKINITETQNRSTPLYAWRVEQIKPTYYHPHSVDNRPVIHEYSLSGHGWSAKLTFGYAPKTEKEYEELEIEPPTKFHPYKVSLNRQGLDIILHDRVVLFHQLSELEIVAMRHSDYNDIRGEIILLNGFSTAITKNSIIHDRHFKECIEKISHILNGQAPGPGNRTENYLRRRTYPEEIPEKLLRDRLKEWLANNPLNRRAEVRIEYVVEGIEGYIDILADREAWELKVDQATAQDIYQLFMYMDVGGFDKGFLIAKDFSPGAKVAASHITQHHNKEIVIATRDQFPINQPPSTTEREEYY